MSYTETLSRFIVNCRFEDFPAPVLDTVRKCVLDWIGVTVGAVGDPGVLLLKKTIEEMGGRPQASVVGYGTRTTMAGAALMNGAMAHALDYDDAHSGVRTHPSAPLAAAIFPVAESLGISGRDFMTAFAAGCEAMLRVGYALGKAYYERGWHSTSILGRLGSAAGVSRLLGLDAQKTSVALGLAATQAGGLRDTFGTMAKPFHSGKAAMDGLLAAVLAKKGFTAPLNILDPDAGFARVFSNEYEAERIVAGLGKDFCTTEINFKPYAACLLVHPVIDALIALRQRSELDPNSVREILASVAPLNVQTAGNPAPKDGSQAKFSLHMAAAVALIHGRATERFFTDQMANDAQIKATMAKVRLFADGALSETEAFVKVLLEGGREDSVHVAAPKGDPRNPMTFEEVAEKARDLASEILNGGALDRIVNLVKDLEKLNDVSELVRLCCTGKQQVGKISRKKWRVRKNRDAAAKEAGPEEER